MMPTSVPLLRVESVSKKFCRSLRRSLRYGLIDLGLELSGAGRRERRLRPDEFWAVRDVSFELHPGDCIGLIGHNGAGKTTLLRMLTGLIKPDHGRIESRGKVAAMIALGAGFNPILSGRENIYVNGALLGMAKREIDQKLDWIIDFSGMAEFIDSPVQSYSSGMTVRLGFSIAAALEPDILILDEVLAVGDMEFRAKCQTRLNEVKRAGGALILVTHSMEQVAHHCNRAILLNRGEVRLSGLPDEVIESYFSSLGSFEPKVARESVAEGPFESLPHYNPDEKRWGDQRAMIVNVDVTQGGQSWPTNFLPGVPLAISMTVCFGEDIAHPIYGLTIKDPQGAEVLQTNSLTLLTGQADSRKGGETVTATFELKPFLDTLTYSLSLGVASEQPQGVTPHDRRYDCAHITFSNPMLATGEPALQPRFHISSLS